MHVNAMMLRKVVFACVITINCGTQECIALALLMRNTGGSRCREAMMKHVAEPDKEFCLSCELGFLFRMLFAAKGAACQVRAPTLSCHSTTNDDSHPRKLCYVEWIVS